MPLFEYFCSICQKRFEQIVAASTQDTATSTCPTCQKPGAKKLLSRFAIGGQGDLRESTLHGCHGHDHSDGTDHSHS